MWYWEISILLKFPIQIIAIVLDLTSWRKCIFLWGNVWKSFRNHMEVVKNLLRYIKKGKKYHNRFQLAISPNGPVQQLKHEKTVWYDKWYKKNEQNICKLRYYSFMSRDERPSWVGSDLIFWYADLHHLTAYMQAIIM